ncbi:MAG: ParB-like nuclease domain protein [Siphoviridae sp. ctvD11]|nr:MAG: ParB-like nuclease domain protein [Siphoviridae sp. ctvD11]
MQLVPVSDLYVQEENPRTITKENFEKLKSSIQKDPAYMELRPILATHRDGKLKIYAGTMRYLACKELGWKEVPVLISDISDQVMRERMLKDNVPYGTWEKSKLELFEPLDLPGLSFETDTIDEQTDTIEPYEKVHVLLSFHPNTFHDIQETLETLRSNPHVEYEQSAN